MKFVPLFRRCTVWVPTRWGMLLLAIFVVLVSGGICWRTEPFLAATHRVSADVLIVEGWIGGEALRAAADEFENGGYRYVVAAGAFSSNRRFGFAQIAAQALQQSGIPEAQIIVAQAPPVDVQRTFAAAAAARVALENHGIAPRGVNVFTLGTHARRTWVVYDKLEAAPVGVIGWRTSRDRLTPWWDSSERIKELLTESCGYLYERILNSGRLNNSVDEPATETTPR